MKMEVAVQIQDLVKTIDTMSDDELLQRVREMRHRREILRPAAKARTERVEKKASRTRMKKTTDLLDDLSEADRLKLIEMLTAGEQS